MFSCLQKDKNTWETLVGRLVLLFSASLLNKPFTLALLQVALTKLDVLFNYSTAYCFP